MKMLRDIASIREVLFLVALIGILIGGCNAPENGTTPGLELAVPTALPYEKVLPGPVEDYEIMQASSKWLHEYILTVSRLSKDGFTLEATKGRSNEEDKAWLMVRNVNKPEGIAASVAYSGN